MKWSDLGQFLVALLVTLFWFVGVPPFFLGWIMMIPLLFGFVWGESRSWQAFVEALVYIVATGCLFSVDNKIFLGILLVVMAIVSLFANFGHYLTGLSKAEAGSGGSLRNMADGGGE